MTVIYGIGLAGAVALMKAFCHIRRCCKQLGHGLLSGILDLTPRCTLLPNMNETLNYTDSRPRARSTGHAFGFESNLGMAVIISGMLSVFLLTMLYGFSWEFLEKNSRFRCSGVSTAIIATNWKRITGKP